MLDNPYAETKTESEEFIRDRIGAVDEKIYLLTTTLASYSNKLDDTVEKIKSLEGKFQEFQDLDNNVSEASISSKCIAEATDRLKRKCNLVMFGCLEVMDDNNQSKNVVNESDSKKINGF